MNARHLRAGAAILTLTAAAPEEPLRTVADLPLPGPAVRFDYQSLDADAGRLYVAHMNADRLLVVDVRKRVVVASLEGVAYARRRS
jgi:hypothetical protein